MNTIEELSPQRLNQVYGCGESWWTRQRQQLVAAGILNKRGKKFFGSLEDVATWLRGRPSNVNSMALNTACASAGAKR